MPIDLHSEMRVLLFFGVSHLEKQADGKRDRHLHSPNQRQFNSTCSHLHTSLLFFINPKSGLRPWGIKENLPDWSFDSIHFNLRETMNLSPFAQKYFIRMGSF